MVVSAHLLTAFRPEIHNPATSPNGPIMWLQLPIVRLCVGGPTALALFFIISGYVAIMKPLAKLKKRDQEGALTDLSKMTLTRPMRLILPAAAATTFSWILAETGAYSMTGRVNAEWIRNGTKGVDSNLYRAVSRLFTACMKTWTEGWDEYDGTQWPMVLLLESSMIAYITMMATVYVSPRTRRILFCLVYWYGWAGGQGMFSSIVKLSSV
jgi:peptidoglycan/LPS O-acetylase OafA/YrhL